MAAGRGIVGGSRREAYHSAGNCKLIYGTDTDLSMTILRSKWFAIVGELRVE